MTININSWREFVYNDFTFKYVYFNYVVDEKHK